MYITIEELKAMQEKCIEEKRSIDARLSVLDELISLAENKEQEAVKQATVEVSVGFEQSEEIEIQDEIA